jgi:hypothetical protein
MLVWSRSDVPSKSNTALIFLAQLFDLSDYFFGEFVARMPLTSIRCYIPPFLFHVLIVLPLLPPFYHNSTVDAIPCETEHSFSDCKISGVGSMLIVILCSKLTVRIIGIVVVFALDVVHVFLKLSFGHTLAFMDDLYHSSGVASSMLTRFLFSDSASVSSMIISWMP